jgi:hypothetical protein
MGELGYHEPYYGGIYGTGTEASESDPVARAALQQAAFAHNQAIKEAAVARGTYVPPGTGNGPQQPMWADQSGGPANLPIVGWTAQSHTAQAFVVQPGKWTAAGMGTVPDWTSDPNPAAAGSYDMTSPPAYNDYRRSDTVQGATAGAGGGAIGAPFFDAPGAQEPDNPNTSSQYSQGSVGPLEW